MRKLTAVAGYMGIKVDGRTKEEIALDVANKAIVQLRPADWRDHVRFASAKEAPGDMAQELGVVPRGIDREVVLDDACHPMGVDQDAEHILTQRCGPRWATVGAAACSAPTSPISSSVLPSPCSAR